MVGVYVSTEWYRVESVELCLGVLSMQVMKVKWYINQFPVEHTHKRDRSSYIYDVYSVYNITPTHMTKFQLLLYEFPMDDTLLLITNFSNRKDEWRSLRKALAKLVCLSHHIISQLSYISPCIIFCT